jgi:hypothetical protein
LRQLDWIPAIQRQANHCLVVDNLTKLRGVRLYQRGVAPNFDALADRPRNESQVHSLTLLNIQRNWANYGGFEAGRRQGNRVPADTYRADGPLTGGITHNVIIKVRIEIHCVHGGKRHNRSAAIYRSSLKRCRVPLRVKR